MPRVERVFDSSHDFGKHLRSSLQTAETFEGGLCDATRLSQRRDRRRRRGAGEKRAVAWLPRGSGSQTPAAPVPAPTSVAVHPALALAHRFRSRSGQNSRCSQFF